MEKELLIVLYNAHSKGITIVQADYKNLLKARFLKVIRENDLLDPIKHIMKEAVIKYRSNNKLAKILHENSLEESIEQSLQNF